MKRISLTIVLTLLAFITGSAQQKDFSSTLKIFYNSNPEFIRLHTDKDFYVSGETIWYKLYLSNVDYTPMDLSLVAYVELTDEQGNILLRNKQKCLEGLSFGTISIPAGLQGGNYHLRAYTLWMNNRGTSLYAEKALPVFNAGNLTEQIAIAAIKPVPCSLQLTKQRTGDRILLTTNTQQFGRLIAHSRGNILVDKIISPGQSAIEMKDVPEGVIQIGFFDNAGMLTCSDSVISNRQGNYDLTIELQDKTIRPKEKVSFNLILKNSTGTGAAGNFSIAIRKRSDVRSPQVYSFEGSLPWDIIIGPDKPDQYRKERFLFPRDPNSLNSLPFTTAQRSEKQISENLASARLPADVTEYYQLLAEIRKSYAGDTKSNVYRDPYLPADNSYDPADFVSMPTLEDFVIEVITEAVIKRRKGEKKIYLRNAEVKNKVFTYKDAPLFLVDGYVYDNLEAILAMDLSEIGKINTTWKESTLNRASIAKLADNGIFAIYSKDGTSLSKRITYKAGIYDGFHRPLVFNYDERRDEGDDHTPDFKSPLYWNPDMVVREKQKITFNTSDELGEFVIDVMGITADGEFVHKQLMFSVGL